VRKPYVLPFGSKMGIYKVGTHKLGYGDVYTTISPAIADYEPPTPWKQLLNILIKLGEGSHKLKSKRLRLPKGWIFIEKREGGWDAMWTTSKDTHQPLSGPSYSVCVDSKGIIQYCKTALSMWMVYDRRFLSYKDPEDLEQAERAVNSMLSLILSSRLLHEKV